MPNHFWSWLSRASISQDHGWYGIRDHCCPHFTRLNMLNVTNQFYDSVCQIKKASKCSSIPSWNPKQEIHNIGLRGDLNIHRWRLLMTQESFPLPALKFNNTLTQDVTVLTLKRFEFHNGWRRRINPLYSLEESYRHDLSGVWVSISSFVFMSVCLMFYSL